MKAKAAHTQNRFLRIITIPIRALGKARDFYVRSITSCSDGVGYGGAAHGAPPLPRSFSTASSASRSSIDNEDFAELIRAASSRSVGAKIDIKVLLQQEMMMAAKSSSGVNASRKMPRSSSVAMGKIDEDKPSVFGEENIGGNFMAEVKYPRSRSYAPTKRNVVF